MIEIFAHAPIEKLGFGIFFMVANLPLFSRGLDPHPQSTQLSFPKGTTNRNFGNSKGRININVSTSLLSDQRSLAY